MFFSSVGVDLCWIYTHIIGISYFYSVITRWLRMSDVHAFGLNRRAQKGTRSLVLAISRLSIIPTYSCFASLLLYIKTRIYGKYRRILTMWEITTKLIYGLVFIIDISYPVVFGLELAVVSLLL